MITVTEPAALKFKAILADLENSERLFVRIYVVSGGCSGWRYDILVDDEFSSEDGEIYSKDGLRIVSDSNSLPYVQELSIDFSDDLVSQGFRITNPNAKRSCGCGASFSKDEAKEGDNPNPCTSCSN